MRISFTLQPKYGIPSLIWKERFLHVPGSVVASRSARCFLRFSFVFFPFLQLYCERIGKTKVITQLIHSKSSTLRVQA